MTNVGRTSKHQRRKTLALKWYHLDHLEIRDIQERLHQHGYTSPYGDDPYFSERTIKKWLNSQESKEVLEQVQREHQNVREQIADRHERMYQRARSAEFEATTDESIAGFEPVEQRVDGRRVEGEMVPYSWEVVEPGEEIPDSAPEGADPDRDTILRIHPDSSTLVEPGQSYPAVDWKMDPIYEMDTVGIERDKPHLAQRSFLRQEQSSHLRQKGEVLGIYEETIQLQGSIEVEHDIPDRIIEAVIKASHLNLQNEEA